MPFCSSTGNNIVEITRPNLKNSINLMSYISATFKTIILCCFLVTVSPGFSAEIKTDRPPKKKLAYLVSDLRIPFWDIMWRGINLRAESWATR